MLADAARWREASKDRRELRRSALVLMVRRVLAIALPLLAASVQTATAMQFLRHPNESAGLTAVLARGDIEVDDAERLRQYLAERAVKHSTAVYLDSPGGSLRGGIALGRHLRAARIKAIVEGGKICASACALALLGGADATGKRWMSTTTTSRLGHHAFGLADGSKFAETDSMQAVVAQVLAYARDVGAPTELLIQLFATPSSSMYWLSSCEALALGIRVWDMEGRSFMSPSRCENRGSEDVKRGSEQR